MTRGGRRDGGKQWESEGEEEKVEASRESDRTTDINSHTTGIMCGVILWRAFRPHADR